MSLRRVGPLLLLLLLLLAAGFAASAGAADSAMDSLLAESDPFVRAPAEVRVELVFSTAASRAEVPLELWRRGDSLALVRFLDPRDRGKYVIRRDGSFFFLSPRAAKPVELAPALAPAGGSALDALLAVRPSVDYRIAATTETGGVVTFELVATADDAPSPRLLWAVDRATRRPLRAEFRSADGSVERLVEFKKWRDGARLEPLEIVAKEVGRGGPPLDVRFVAMEARPVPEALFDLSDGSARAALPAPRAAPR